MQPVVEAPAPFMRPLVEGLIDIATLLAAITLTGAVTPYFAIRRDVGLPMVPTTEPWLPSTMATSGERRQLVKAGPPTPTLAMHWGLGLDVLLVVVLGLAFTFG